MVKGMWLEALQSEKEGRKEKAAKRARRMI
jgi:hypothetical protein